MFNFLVICLDVLFSFICLINLSFSVSAPCLAVRNFMYSSVVLFFIFIFSVYFALTDKLFS